MLKIFINFVLLLTVPGFLVYPNNNFHYVTFQKTNCGYQQNTQEWIYPKTYDEIIQLLEDLESGELERKCSITQLEKVNDYLVILAKKGILPDELEEEIDIEEDSYNLLYGEDIVFQLTNSLGINNKHIIIPAVFNGYSDYDIIQCGKISKAWKKTKKFAKKHKTAIIIGTVVVAATAAVVIAASSAAAATAAAGASGAVASGASSESNFSVANSSESSKSESKEEPPDVSSTPKETPSFTDMNETPIMKAAINKHVSSFKEFLTEDKAIQEAVSFKERGDLSFREKAREFGSGLTHKAFDEIIDLVKVVPQLCEEIKEINSKLFSETLTFLNGENGSPIENYDNFVAKGHQVIDKVFSTNQSEYFIAKANDLMNNFVIGFLPPPGAVFKTFSDASKFAKAGKVIDRGGFTKAGRHLMKHGYREGSVFPKPLGNPSQVNAHGQQVLESIVNHPERMIYERPHPDFGKVIEIVVPDKCGVRFTIEGNMIGFLEP